MHIGYLEVSCPKLQEGVKVQLTIKQDRTVKTKQATVVQRTKDTVTFDYGNYKETFGVMELAGAGKTVEYKVLE